MFFLFVSIALFDSINTVLFTLISVCIFLLIIVVGTERVMHFSKKNTASNSTTPGSKKKHSVHRAQNKKSKPQIRKMDSSKKRLQTGYVTDSLVKKNLIIYAKKDHFTYNNNYAFNKQSFFYTYINKKNIKGISKNYDITLLMFGDSLLKNKSKISIIGFFH